jgi:hypothetical protein
MTTHTTTRRRPLPPATGTVRWLAPIDGVERLRITCGPVSRDYAVEEVPGGYRLATLDMGTSPPTPRSYRIDLTRGWHAATCTCPDATSRPERRHRCKHVLALKAALAAEPF